VNHWLEDEGDWPVYKLEDGNYGDEEVEQDDADGPADPIKDSAGPGEIDVHCVCVVEARVELAVRVYPCQWNRVGLPGVDWIVQLAQRYLFDKEAKVYSE